MNCHTPASHCGMPATSPSDDLPTDTLRAAGWQPTEPMPCGCTPERLCAPHGWLRDAEQWERYVSDLAPRHDNS